MSFADERVVRRGSRRRIEEWSLVLSALGVPHGARQDDEGWAVVVAAADESRARDALDGFDREGRGRRPRRPRPWTLAGVHAAVVLAAIQAVAGPGAWHGERFQAGLADAHAIVRGQWWRAVTALTLHADEGHLLGNAVFGALLIGALGGAVGNGVALALAVAAGTAGNLLNAWLRVSAHESVGASTAIFGAVGALAATAFLERRRSTEPTLRPWTALGAGLALLAMLGTSEQSDLGAHLFGFAAGIPLGALAATLPRLSRAGQTLLGLATAAAVAGAWWLALAR